MLQKGHVLAAVSGGADSVSMLHILYRLRTEYNFMLEAAHINHGLRGAESDADEQFVRGICMAMNVPLHVLRADVAKQAAETGEGIEACARRVRYAYLQSLAQGEIATAHTETDNSETVLLHLTRGSGLRGLCGIPPVRGNIIRPLIDCTRREVEEYCAANGLSYVTDSSNLSDGYARNRIRHHFLPVLQTVNPAVEEAVGRCTQTLTREEDYLRQSTAALLEKAVRPFGYDAAVLRGAHPALQYRAAAEILRTSMDREPQQNHVEDCVRLLFENGAVQTEQGTTAACYGGVFYLEKPLRADWTAPISDNTARLPFGSAKIDILQTENIQFVHNRDLAKCLCCDTITGDVFFRSRKEGDRLCRVHSGCTKTLKKHFEELGVPACYRNDIAVLTDGTDVLWVEGLGCDARFAVTPRSEKVMKIEIIREEK